MGVEFYESNAQRAYPFVATRGVYSGSQVDGLIVDAVATDPLYTVSSLTLPIGASSALELRPNGGGAAVTLGTPKHVNTLGGYTTAQWWDADVRNRLVVLTFNTAHALYGVSGTLDFSAALSPFVSRVVAESAEMVTNLNGVGSGQVMQLAAGHNTSMQVDPDTALVRLRKLSDSAQSRPGVRRIILNASPGLGSGQRAADCTTTELYTINKTGTLNGQFQLTSGNGCYRFTRPDSSPPTAGELTLGNDCTACCDCDEFVAMLDQIRALVNKGLEVKTTWNATAVKYQELVDAIAAQQTCFGDGLTAKVMAYAYTGWVTTVQVWLGNSGKTCVSDGISVEVEFRGQSPLYVQGSGLVCNDQSQYAQIDPVYRHGKFVLTDHSALAAGGYKTMAMSARMQPSGSRVNGAVTQVVVTVTAGSVQQTIYSAVKILAPTLKH